MKKMLWSAAALFFLAGCSNELYEEAMKKGKLALADADFDKARSSFELALEEEPDDPDASRMAEQLRLLEKTETAAEEGNWSEVSKQASLLLEKDNLQSQLKEQAEEYTAAAEAETKAAQKVAEQLAGVQSKVSEGSYEEARVLLDELEADKSLDAALLAHQEEVDAARLDIEASKKEQQDKEQAEAVQAAADAAAATAVAEASKGWTYEDQLDDLSGRTADFDYIVETGTTAQALEAEQTRYKQWDNLLNEIYGTLKSELPNDEFVQLRAAQREWITYRDESAAEAASSYAGTDWEDVQYKMTQAYLTEIRCYELVDRYMD